MYEKYFCVRTFTGPKTTFVTNGIPIGFQKARGHSKNAKKYNMERARAQLLENRIF